MSFFSRLFAYDTADTPPAPPVNTTSTNTSKAASFPGSIKSPNNPSTLEASNDSLLARAQKRTTNSSSGTNSKSFPGTVVTVKKNTKKKAKPQQNNISVPPPQPNLTKSSSLPSNPNPSSVSNFASSLNIDDDSNSDSANSVSSQPNPPKSSQPVSNTLSSGNIQDSINDNILAKFKACLYGAEEASASTGTIDLKTLRSLSWNGIPPAVRSHAWQVLIGYLPSNRSRQNTTRNRKRGEYQKERSAVNADSNNVGDGDNASTSGVGHRESPEELASRRQIIVDLPRTAPDVPLFSNPVVRKSLERILYVWACRHPGIGYVQGMSDLVCPIYAVILGGYYGGKIEEVLKMDAGGVAVEIREEVEADVYHCFTAVLRGILDHYTVDQPGIQRMVWKMSELVRRVDEQLWDHLKAEGVEFLTFGFKWMNCLLMREMTIKCIIRIWDTYLSEGDGSGTQLGFEQFHIYFCAAFLCKFSEDIKGKPFDEIFGFLQDLPTNNWGDEEIGLLLSQAFVLNSLFADSDAHLNMDI